MLEVRARTPPEALRALVSRFDREVIDIAPGQRPRLRLTVGSEEWDALIRDGRAELVPGEGRAAADALLSADNRTWERIAADVRGGMDAFRAGRLSVRRNLHLGVGFLAATSGMTEPGRLRFDSIATRHARLSILSAGSGNPVICVHGLGGTKASFLPTVAALAERHRARPAGIRRIRQADCRRL